MEKLMEIANVTLNAIDRAQEGEVVQVLYTCKHGNIVATFKKEK
jgi:hypothetical protein